MQRSVGLSRVCRVYTGPRVSGCHPVLVSLDRHQDKQDILQVSLARHTGGPCKGRCRTDLTVITPILPHLDNDLNSL